MKWKEQRQSDNVEVDCLGETVNLKSPEAQAAFSCQAEVTKLREQYVGHPSTDAEKERREALFSNAIKSFLNSVPVELHGTDEQK